ncbi:helix-turn-helix transcriptional regulator [Parerythrobacter lacustris]|uniref:LuxR family transcriptional regulator n=1 Tax=Parerythrobacter lacustris TaxID=2969984 RepID=A0ABT1XRJ9_9SPHN|nr:LuxR family transcriptional regulator [Parerythrobacter lacustris]MCR2833295.1 LuxR family transcriptional regulator [Parerythrobacter lacustris]
MEREAKGDFGLDLGRQGAGAPTKSDGELFREFTKILIAPNVLDLIAQMSKLANIYGFGALYAVSPITRDKQFCHHMTAVGFPSVWERQWKRRLYWVDPLLDYALYHPQVFRWSRIFSEECSSKAQRRYVEFCSQLGMTDGLATACYGPGGRTGFVGFGFPEGEDCFSAQSYLAIAHIAQLSFARYCTIMHGKAATPPRLSPREREIMRWVARGKSNSEIAIIVGISRHTVDTHLRRVFSKFGTTDRTVACLRAVELGCILISETDTLIGPDLR